MARGSSGDVSPKSPEDGCPLATMAQVASDALTDWHSHDTSVQRPTRLLVLLASTLAVCSLVGTLAFWISVAFSNPSDSQTDPIAFFVFLIVTLLELVMVLVGIGSLATVEFGRWSATTRRWLALLAVVAFASLLVLYDPNWFVLLVWSTVAPRGLAIAAAFILPASVASTIASIALAIAIYVRLNPRRQVVRQTIAADGTMRAGMIALAIIGVLTIAVIYLTLVFKVSLPVAAAIGTASAAAAAVLAIMAGRLATAAWTADGRLSDHGAAMVLSLWLAAAGMAWPYLVLLVGLYGLVDPSFAQWAMKSPLLWPVFPSMSILLLLVLGSVTLYYSRVVPQTPYDWSQLSPTGGGAVRKLDPRALILVGLVLLATILGALTVWLIARLSARRAGAELSLGGAFTGAHSAVPGV